MEGNIPKLKNKVHFEKNTPPKIGSGDIFKKTSRRTITSEGWFPPFRNFLGTKDVQIQDLLGWIQHQGMFISFNYYFYYQQAICQNFSQRFSCTCRTILELQGKNALLLKKADRDMIPARGTCESKRKIKQLGATFHLSRTFRHRCVSCQARDEGKTDVRINSIRPGHG